MSKTLSPAALATYRRDGYCFPVPALSAAEVAHYRGCLESHEAKTGAPLQGNWRHKAHLLFTWVDGSCTIPRLLTPPRKCTAPTCSVGPPISSSRRPTAPASCPGTKTPSIGGSARDAVMTAWVALSPANLESGCMKFIPGSQTQDHLQHVDTFHKDNLLSRGQEIAVEVDAAKSIDVILNAGELSLHHVKAVHGSEPNRSNDRRIGLAIRYIPTDVRQIKVRDSATLVRGVDRHGNFEPEPRPMHDLDEAALAAHADAVERQVKALYSERVNKSSVHRRQRGATLLLDGVIVLVDG